MKRAEMVEKIYRIENKLAELEYEVSYYKGIIQTATQTHSRVVESLEIALKENEDLKERNRALEASETNELKELTERLHVLKRKNEELSLALEKANKLLLKDCYAYFTARE